MDAVETLWEHWLDAVGTLWGRCVHAITDIFRGDPTARWHGFRTLYKRCGIAVWCDRGFMILLYILTQHSGLTCSHTIVCIVYAHFRNTYATITLRPRIPRIAKNWQFSGFVVESLSVREVPISFVYIRSDRFVVNQGLHESLNELFS